VSSGVVIRFLVLSLLLGAAPAAAQTVRDIANRGACSTAGLEGISQQLADSQGCMRPGQFVRFAPHAGISLSGSRVHPYLQASARDAVHRVADRGTSLTVNSAFRTLADQYVLYHSGGCGLAAQPGSSNHQSGRALDIGNYSAARSALEAAGCAWLGSRDPVHFDCPGRDLRSDTILTFQKLWNVNNPSDRITEDGLYGPQSESRLSRTPASGFARDLCSCEAHCEGATIVGEDCGRGDCGAFGATCADDSLGVRCVSVFCSPMGEADVCLDGTQRAHCSDGAIGEPTACPAGSECVGAGECMNSTAPIDMGPMTSADLGPSEEPDAGIGERDATVPTPDLGTGGEGFDMRVASGGCGCRAAGREQGGSALLLAAALLFVRRRR
jgi:hypothetical protein